MKIGSRLLHTLRQMGWFNAAGYWLAQGLSRCSGGYLALCHYRYVAQQVNERSLTGNRGSDIAIHRMEPDARLPDGYPRSPHVVAGRFAQGAYSLAAWRNGRLAGFLWLIDGSYDEDEVRARFTLADSDACWDFDVWVHPDERLGLVFARLWDAARATLHGRGVRWSCSRISAFNPASARAHARIGSQPLGSAIFLRCGSWQWLAATIAPYVHLSRCAQERPVFRFQTAQLQA